METLMMLKLISLIMMANWMLMVLLSGLELWNECLIISTFWKGKELSLLP